MKTIVYVDGFNLYHRQLKGTHFKWLNLEAFFDDLLKEHHEVTAVNYFTARVSPRKNNPKVHERQNAYLRALQHCCPRVEQVFGHFLQQEKRMANANPPPSTVSVLKIEEKGSDVNLATRFLNDAWLDRYECGIIVSNDSDMASAMKLVRTHHPKKRVGLINTASGRASKELASHAHFVRTVRAHHLSDNQLPHQIPDSNLVIPKQWVSPTSV